MVGQPGSLTISSFTATCGSYDGYKVYNDALGADVTDTLFNSFDAATSTLTISSLEE